MDIEQFSSSNGIQSLLIDSPNTNIVSVQFWFKAGSSLESKEDHGIAHFLEHMFFKGSKKYPKMKIAKTIEAFGGEINAFTSFDYTCYYINAPHTKGIKSLDVLLDMVCNPLFLLEDLIPERGVVFEEYLRSVDNPSQFNFFQIQKASFPKGYNHAILGNEKTIKNFDVKQLKKFRSQFYNKNNALLVVAGNLKKVEKYRDLIDSYKLPTGQVSKFPKFVLKNKNTIDIHSKPVNQSTLTLAISAPSFEKPAAALEDLALNTLTFGDMSPLYKYFIDETSLANGISGSTMFFSKGGTHFLRITFPPENLEKVLKQIPKRIEQALLKGFSQEDLDRIRNQYVASKIYEKESIESFAFSLGHGFAQNGDIHSDEKYITSMEHIAAESLVCSLQDIFSRPIHITLQTPQEFEKSVEFSQLENMASQLQTIKKINLKKEDTVISFSEFDSSVKEMEILPGIKLIHRHNPLSDTFALHTFIKGGLSEETKKSNGIFNLIAKNITYGYEGVDYNSLKSDLERKASYINGFSGRNAYGLNLQGLSRFTDELFNHYFQTLFSPSFPIDKFEIEKELLLRALHLQKEDPVKQCFSAFSDIVFNKHSYQFDIIGSEKSLEGLEQEDLIKLHERKMKTAEMVITYCGNASFETVKSKLNHYLSRKKRKVKRVDHTIKKGPAPLIGKKVHIKFDREQTHFMIGKPAFKNDSKEDIFLKIFSSLLSGQSSELFMTVRDKKGLCYTVQPLHNSSIEAGYWGIYMGTSTDKYEEALAELMKIIKKYQQKGISQRDFNMVKEMIYGQNLVNVQTNDDYAYFYSVPVLHGLGLDYPYRSLEKIREVNLDDLNKFLSNYLDGNWSIVTVGKN